MHRELALILAFAATTMGAQGIGQTSYRLVLTQDLVATDIRGAGVAVVHGIWNRGDFASSVAGGAVRLAGEWSQSAGVDFPYVPISLHPSFARRTPYVRFEANKTRLGGALKTGYVAFIGLVVREPLPPLVRGFW